MAMSLKANVKVKDEEQYETLDLTNSDDERPTSPPITVCIDETNVQVLENKELLLTCQTCSACFTQLPLFIEHIVDHEMRKRQKHICKICQSVFGSVEQLRRHDLKHAINIFICKVCSSCYSTSICRDGHELTHSSKNNSNCKKCTATFTTKAGLRRHMEEIHVSVSEICECDLCGLAYYAPTSLRRHMVLKHDVSGDFHCYVCLEKFSESITLRTHLKINEKCGKPYVCTKCNFRTSLSTNLKKHMYSHSDERLFICEICDKKFKKEDSVARHLYTHLSEKPFRCDLCPKQFARADHLKRHMDIHSGRRLFNCSKCTASFLRRNTYTSHVALHTSGKELPTCDVCGYQTASKKGISAHIKRDHKHL